MEKERNRRYYFFVVLVVFIGTTAAYALNSFRDSIKAGNLEEKYLKSLQADIDKNIEELKELIEIIEDNDNAIQKLVVMVSKEEYNSDTIIKYSARMSFSFEFIPYSATFDTLKTTGDIEFISDYDLKDDIVQLYHEYEEIKESDQLHKKFMNDHIIPYLWENIDMINGKALNDNFYKTSAFNSILTDYLLILSQQKEAYKRGIEMSIELVEMISEKN